MIAWMIILVITILIIFFDILILGELLTYYRVLDAIKNGIAFAFSTFFHAIGFAAAVAFVFVITHMLFFDHKILKWGFRISIAVLYILSFVEGA